MQGMIRALQSEIWIYIALFIVVVVVYKGALRFINSAVPPRGGVDDKEDARVSAHMIRSIVLYIFLLTLFLVAIARTVPHFSP